MKKKFFALLSILVLTTSIVLAKTESPSNELSNAIKLYKAGNYSECYVKLENIIKEDPANVMAYYYMAITSAQIGRRDEAISNYEKVLTLNPVNNNLSRYARKGKRCIETPEKCEESLFETFEDEFIQSRKGFMSSEEVRGDFERLKIENLMREMNRKDDVDAQKFKEFKDFSSLPTNDEIVAAMRVLQRAGFNNMLGNSSDLSLLTGGQQGMLHNILGNSSMNPQLIQALLTNNITQGF